MMDWRRGVCLPDRNLNNLFTAVLRLMGLVRVMRLLRVFAVMVVEMRAALHSGEISSTIAIIVRM